MSALRHPKPEDLQKLVGPWGRSPFDQISPYQTISKTDVQGGIVFFDNDISQASFEALAKILGVDRSPREAENRKFSIFPHTSENPGQDGYIAVLRLVDRFGLRYGFESISGSEYESFPENGSTMSQAMWTFVEYQRQKYGVSFTQNKGLYGMFGGDGYWAIEQLSFGLMAEDADRGVFRIWSRAWLVTK